MGCVNKEAVTATLNAKLGHHYFNRHPPPQAEYKRGVFTSVTALRNMLLSISEGERETQSDLRINCHMESPLTLLLCDLDCIRTVSG